MLLKIAALVVGLYLAALLAGYIVQRRLIYAADPKRTSPASIGLPDVEELSIPAPDGATVVAWYGKARPRQPTILYFHGNGGTLADRKPRIERFMSQGWGVMMMSYRGYSGSTGEPSERANVADAIRTFDRLTESGVPSNQVVLYGESLGTGVAAQVALARSAKALILDAPFTSVPDVAARRFPLAPVQWLLTERYATAANIARISIPILILHGRLDTTVPVDMGRSLAQLANEPKIYVEFPNGGHSDLYLNGNDALSAVRDFIVAHTMP